MKFLKISEKNFVVLLFIANLLLRLFRLNSPSEAYFDEKGYYLKAVRDILAGKSDPNYPHPPLAKELIGVGIKIFGDNPWGWRALQAILASIAVVVIYFIAKRLFKSRKIAAVASLLMSVEISWFVLSRVAIPEMFMISFFTFSLFFLVKFYQEKDSISLIAGSGFFGLALACKWAPLIFLPIVAFIFIRKFQLGKIEKLKVAIIASLVIFGSYLLPFFLLPAHPSVKDIVNFHLKTTKFHLIEEKKLVNIESDLSNSAVFWPVDVYFLTSKPTKGGNTISVIFFYNPAILWTALVVTFLLFKKFLKNRLLGVNEFLVSSFLIFWVVWFASPRDTYPYYWAIAMPFAAILVANFFVEKMENYSSEVGAGLSLAVLIFGFYYPLLTNWPVKAWYLQLLTGIGFK